MSARPDTWMPVYWGDYARDTGHLNAAGHGAYLMLIKHYWSTGEPLANDDDELWRIACCDSKREWLKLRQKVARLFQVDGDRLRHKRVDKEIAKAAANAEAKAKAGRKGAAKRWRTDGTAIAEPSPSHRQTDATSPSPSPKGKEPPSGGSKKRRTGTRIPEDYEPDLSVALAEGLSLALAKREAARFVDWAKAAPGQKGVKADWDAAWRNWCRKAAEDRGLTPASAANVPKVETTWVTDEALEWPALASRWQEDRGRPPPKVAGLGGLGWRFPSDWFPALKRAG